MTEQKILEQLLGLLESDGGTMAKSKLSERLPFLKDSEIARIFAQHAPDVHETMVANIPCWQRIQLPANFSEHLKEAVASLEEVGFEASMHNIALALSLRYGKNFRTTCNLADDGDYHRLLKRHGFCQTAAPTRLYDLKGGPFTARKWKTYVKGWNNPKRKEIEAMRKNGMSFDDIVEKTGMERKEVFWLRWLTNNMPIVLLKNNLKESDIMEDNL